MFRKSILLIVSVLLLSLMAAGAVQAQQDPNLVGWWTFDEAEGTVVRDSSGHGYDGTVTNAQWVNGLLGSALNFNAVGHVDAPAQAWSTISRQLTVAFWSYGDPAIQPQANFTFGAFSNVSDNNARVASCHAPWSDGTVYWDTSGDPGATFNPNRISKTATASEYEGEWRHWAFVKNVDTGVQSIYLNGALWHSATGMTKVIPGNTVTGFSIGDRPAHDSPYGGLIDDFRLYNRALTLNEIKKLAARPKAYAPIPGDGATGVLQPLLQWTSGTVAQWHDVYLGKTPELGQAEFKGRQQIFMAMYWEFAGLTPGQTYYWRVDEVEVDSTVHTGDVWSFTTAPNTAYDCNPRNGDKWLDPNVDLSWKPGQGSTKHNLYFGTDRTKVEARDASVLKGSLGTTTYEPGTLTKETTYYWVVDEVGAVNYPGELWSFTTGGGPGGVKGEYFANTSRDLPGAPALTRIDPSIDFTWGTSSPGTPIGVDYFSVRWTADLEIAVADAYTFIVRTDDGGRLWLNDQRIVNAWVDRGAADSSSRPQMLEPGIYSLVMEYYEWGGDASAQLYWQTPSVARQIIPPGPLQPPVRARAIYPKDADVNIPQDATLTWTIGDKAVTHHVYLGTDKAAVEAATTADTAVYKGSQGKDENTFAPADLEFNTTYYWRVDEVNDTAVGSPWKGSVWSFTTADFIIVDDFETYTNDSPDRLFQTWIDGYGFSEDEFFPAGDPGNGTGSAVGHDIWAEGTPYTDIVETSVVRPGSTQSMPLGYNNGDSPFNSEAERTWTSPQNWTLNDVKILSLQVYGYRAAPTPVAVTETGGKMSVTGAGADIWFSSDEFTFAYKTLNGDGSLIAKVVSNGTGSNTWAKGGVMIRDSLDGGSASAQMAMTGGAGNGATFQNRPVTGGDMSVISGTNFEAGSAITLPYWVKIERFGDTLTGYVSSDGAAWSVMNSVDIVMTAPVYIGLCVTSHAAGEDRTFQFEGIKSAGGVSGQWQGAIIDSPMWNSLQDFYVVLQDSLGKSAVVSNATAVNSGDWLDVQMPLSDFTAVNPAKIKKMIVGVGKHTNPVADGSGSLFIDDIRVIKPAP